MSLSCALHLVDGGGHGVVPLDVAPADRAVRDDVGHVGGTCGHVGLLPGHGGLHELEAMARPAGAAFPRVRVGAGGSTLRGMLCPDLVGRDAEAAALRQRVRTLSEGTGGLTVLVGEAGAGKSRLAREAMHEARALDLPILSGRAVPGSSPVPYRPITEAFLAAFRGAPPPDVPALAGFGAHLGRLV